jgi:hypothetical protein
MSALEWLRSKATHQETYTLLITPEEATKAECEPGAYEAVRVGFAGTIPVRMARSLRGAKLVNTETENEVLHLGNGYVGGEGQCRYYRTTYTLKA